MKKVPYLKSALFTTILVSLFSVNTAQADWDLDDMFEDMFEGDNIGATNDNISLLQAIDKAEDSAHGYVKSIERDKKGLNRIVYEASVIDRNGVEWDVNVNAKTGQTSKMRDWDVDPEDYAENKLFYKAVNSHFLIDISKAVTKAQSQAAGTPVAADIEYRMGKLVYEVDMLNRSGITTQKFIPAKTFQKEKNTADL